jgi:hypothetical protein
MKKLLISLLFLFGVLFLTTANADILSCRMGITCTRDGDPTSCQLASPYSYFYSTSGPPIVARGYGASRAVYSSNSGMRCTYYSPGGDPTYITFMSDRLIPDLSSSSWVGNKDSATCNLGSNGMAGCRMLLKTH